MRFQSDRTCLLSQLICTALLFPITSTAGGLIFFLWIFFRLALIMKRYFHTWKPVILIRNGLRCWLWKIGPKLVFERVVKFLTASKKFLLSDVETLNLCFTGLKTTEKILKLKSLKRLYLRHNQIEDMNEIRKLKKLPKLTSLSLIGNPICKSADYRLGCFLVFFTKIGCGRRIWKFIPRLDRNLLLI